MKSDFLIALTQLAAERHLPKEQVLQAIEVALASAFRKDNPAGGQNITVKLNPNTGDVNVFALKTVVETVEDVTREIGLADAQQIKQTIELGDEVAAAEPLPHNASRIAAQTAKQVVLQRLREAERERLYEEFVKHKDDIISGVVEQIEPGRAITLELGRVQAIMPPEEQVPTERYKKGQRLKAFVLDVRNTPKGPEILVSRSHRNMLRRLFEIEVPEVHNGVVEIQSIARTAGSRSKVAVNSTQEGIDPVGSCIGIRGNRIQSIVNELQGEKIDVVPWNRDPRTFIAKALSPSEVVNVELEPDEQTAMVVVPDRQLSLAIGKEGQNARLAARLTGWRLDIKGVTEWQSIKEAKEEERRLAAIRQAEEAAAEKAAVAASGTAVVEAEVDAEPALVAELETALVETPVAAVAEEIPAIADSEPVAVADAATETIDKIDEAALLEAMIREEDEAVAARAEEEAGLSVDELSTFTLDDMDETVLDEGEDDGDLVLVPDIPVLTPDAGKIRFAEDLVGDFRGGSRRSRRGGGARRGGGGRR
jgi:N utilization substance protein A